MAPAGLESTTWENVWVVILHLKLLGVNEALIFYTLPPTSAGLATRRSKNPYFTAFPGDTPKGNESLPQRLWDIFPFLVGSKNPIKSWQWVFSWAADLSRCIWCQQHFLIIRYGVGQGFPTCCLGPKSGSQKFCKWVANQPSLMAAPDLSLLSFVSWKPQSNSGNSIFHHTLVGIFSSMDIHVDQVKHVLRVTRVNKNLRKDWRE